MVSCSVFDLDYTLNFIHTLKHLICRLDVCFLICVCVSLCACFCTYDCVYVYLCVYLLLLLRINTSVYDRVADKFRGDTELWVRLLLPGVIKRVYNLQSKQLVKVFSQVCVATSLVATLTY